jgi:hypothetical protein
MTYITPRRFRSMGLGVDVGDRTDAALDALLEIATSKVDTYCNVPEEHSFFGGTVLNEQRIWHPGNTHAPGQRRVWPLHRPIKEVTSLAIDVTNGQYVQFTPSNLYIDHHLDSVEITSLQLTPAAVFTTGLAPYISLQNPRSRMSYTYGWEFTAHERLKIASSTPPGFEFQLDNQFASASGVSVTKNGTELTPMTDYEFDDYEGVVTLIAPVTRADVVFVDYTYPLPNNIAKATALIGEDVVNWANQMGIGLGGLSGLSVNEVNIRVSKNAGFSMVPVNPAAQEMLARYMYRGFAS